MPDPQSTRAASEMQEYERHRNAAEELLTEFPKLGYLSRHWQRINAIATILARHFPAPAPPTPQEKPGEPGWYECRHLERGDRNAYWWNGSDLFFDRDERNKLFTPFYTDFIGPLVPAGQDGELRRDIQECVADLEEIVCVKEPDDGVVLLSDDGPTHWDEEQKCQVYDHRYFSPLGDALIALHKKLAALATPAPNQETE